MNDARQPAGMPVATATSASASQFAAQFNTYLERARLAKRENQHHDQRRQLFLDFLRAAFGIGADEVEVEQYIQIADRRVDVGRSAARIRKGWIDAVFRDVIFEFKRDLVREEAEGLRELRDYLTTIPNGDECVGLLTDGLIFRAYVLDDTQQPTGLRRTDAIDFEKIDASQVAFLWLDAYLLRQRGSAPTAEDIVRRFGLASPTFVAASRRLHQALTLYGAGEAGALEVKRAQWAFHLARVYGSADMTSDELFIRHTYLCQFARLLAYTARFGVGAAADQIERIIDGGAFESLGFANIGEQDFFAWTAAPAARAITFGVFRQIVASLAVYDLSRIDQDLLKQLYQNLVDPETRHDLGEFYTPDWLAELTLREIGYGPGKSLLDPACGSGAFLFTAIRLLQEQGVTGEELVDFALDNIMGL
ncbi:MAG: N-6 DNA methylase, partial [Ktedonobacterales bacterium]